jgi:hypothetical protein
MLVNIDRPLWRQSRGARATSAGDAVRVVFDECKQAAWQFDRAVNKGQPHRVAQMRKLLESSAAFLRPRCHGEQLVPDYRTMLGSDVPITVEGAESWWTVRSWSSGSCFPLLYTSSMLDVSAGRELQSDLNRTSDDAQSRQVHDPGWA